MPMQEEDFERLNPGYRDDPIWQEPWMKSSTMAWKDMAPVVGVDIPSADGEHTLREEGQGGVTYVVQEPRNLKSVRVGI